MAERIEQATPETYRGDNHLVLNDSMSDRSFIEATMNCDRLVVSFHLLTKRMIFDRNIILHLLLDTFFITTRNSDTGCGEGGIAITNNFAKKKLNNKYEYLN